MKFYNLLLIVSLFLSLKPWWNWNSFNPFSYFRRSSYKGECLKICEDTKIIKQSLDYAIDIKTKYVWQPADFNNLIRSIEYYESQYERFIALYIKCLMLTAGKNLYESKRKRNDFAWDKLNYITSKNWLIENKKFIVDKMFKYNKIDKQKSSNCIISLNKEKIEDLFSDKNLDNLLSIT